MVYGASGASPKRARRNGGAEDSKRSVRRLPARTSTIDLGKETVRIRVGGVSRTVRQDELMVMTMINRALKGTFRDVEALYAILDAEEEVALLKPDRSPSPYMRRRAMESLRTLITTILSDAETLRREGLLSRDEDGRFLVSAKAVLAMRQRGHPA